MTPMSDALQHPKKKDWLELLGAEEEQEFDDIAELAAFICGTPMGLITLLQGEWQYHKAAIGLDLDKVPLSQSFCQYAVKQDGVFVVRDADRDERFHDSPLVTSAPFIRFYAGIPLYSPTGDKIGAICVLDTIPRELKESQTHALSLLARQANARIELRIRQKQTDEQRLNEV